MSIKTISYLEKALVFLTIFLFGFIPLYPKFPIFNVAGTFVAVRLEDFVIAITILLWFTLEFYLKRDSLNSIKAFFMKTTIGKSFMLFFLMGIFSLFSAYFLTHTITFNLGLLHFFRRVEYMLLLPLCATVITTRKRFIGVLLVLLFTLFAVNIYGYGQQYLNWPVISTTNSEFSKGTILRLTPGARVNSTFAGHYDLAVFLASAIVFLVCFLFSSKKIWKAVLTIGIGLSSLLLVFTAARISFVALVVGLVFALIFIKKKKYLLLILLFVIAAAIYPSQLRNRFISTITINVLNMGQRYEGRNLNQQLESKLNIPTLFYRMASRSATQSAFATASGGLPIDITPGEPINVTELDVYRSFQIRLNAEWPNATRAFVKNPFFGLGYSSLGLATDNDFLRSLGEIGFLGTIAFMLVLLSIWKKIYRGLKNEDNLKRVLSGASLSLIIVILINGSFIDVFEASKTASLFWMMLGLNIGVLKD